VRTVIH